MPFLSALTQALPCSDCSNAFISIRERYCWSILVVALIMLISHFIVQKIWWAPLQANISIDTQKLIERMWKTHEENVDFLQPKYVLAFCLGGMVSSLNKPFLP